MPPPGNKGRKNIKKGRFSLMIFYALFTRLVITTGRRRAKADDIRTTTSSVNSGILKRLEFQQCPSIGIRAPVVVIDLTEDSDTEQQSLSDGEIKSFHFNLSPKMVTAFVFDSFMHLIVHVIIASTLILYAHKVRAGFTHEKFNGRRQL